MKLLALDTSTALCGVAVWDTVSGSAAARREQVTTHSERLLQLISECLAELGLRPAELDGVACGAGPGSFTGLRIGAATAKGLCFALARPLRMVSSLEVMAATPAADRIEQAGRTDPPAPGDRTGPADRAADRTDRYTAPSQTVQERPVLAVLDAFRGQVFARVLPGRSGSGTALPPRLAELLAAHPSLGTDAVWDPAQLAALLAPVGDALAVCGGGLRAHPALRLPGSVLLTDDPYPHPLALAWIAAAQLARGDASPLASAAPNYLVPSAAEVSTGKLDPGQPARV